MEVVLLLPPRNSFGLSTNRGEHLQGKRVLLNRAKRGKLTLSFLQSRRKPATGWRSSFWFFGRKKATKRGTELVGNCFTHCTLQTLHNTHDLQCIAHYTMCITHDLQCAVTPVVNWKVIFQKKLSMGKSKSVTGHLHYSFHIFRHTKVVAKWAV